MHVLALAFLIAAPALAMAQTSDDPPTSAPNEGHLDDPYAHAHGTEWTDWPLRDGSTSVQGLDEPGIDEPAADPTTDEPGMDEPGTNEPTDTDPSEEYVLGQSSLRLDMPSSPLSLAPTPSTDVDIHHDLELALRLPTYDFDGVSFISASRSIITAVLETYCAAGLLFPGEDGYDAGEVILGAGCLLGATTLYIMGIRKLLHPSEERRAVERLARFEALRDGEGLSEEDVALFENELQGAARRDRRRRIIEIIFGGLNVVATATIAGLTARGRIDTTVGTSIATGTAALGVLSLSSIFVRSPSERAWSTYESR